MKEINYKDMKFNPFNLNCRKVDFSIKKPSTRIIPSATSIRCMSVRLRRCW